MRRPFVVAVAFIALFALGADTLLAYPGGRRARRGRNRSAYPDPGQQRGDNARQQREAEERASRRGEYAGCEPTDREVRNATIQFIDDNDRDNDNRLSSDEFAEAESASDLFDALDRNSDSQADFDELKSYIRESMRTAAAREIVDDQYDALRRRHDRNRDHEVTLREWRGEDAEFEAADLDGDGTIDRDELRVLARETFEAENGTLPSEDPEWTERRTAREAAQAEADARAEERESDRAGRLAALRDALRNNDSEGEGGSDEDGADSDD